MTNAVFVSKCGDPDVLTWGPIEVRTPEEGEVRIKQTAIGVNFIDIYFRRGDYPLPSYPAVLGMEAAGTVVAVGEGVVYPAVGDRVAYASLPLGAYAEERVIAAERVIVLPEGQDRISDEEAAAILLKGLTAEYLLHDGFPVKKGSSVLLYAAAGGLGQILGSWAAHKGAHVIGVVGSDEKAAVARANGCTDVIVSSRQKIDEGVLSLTSGRGVDVVYDSVGRATFEESMTALATCGTFVSLGQSSGALTAEQVGGFLAAQSKSFRRPRLADFTRTSVGMRDRAERVFEAYNEGTLGLRVGQAFALRDAAEAHSRVEKRLTMGTTILVP